MMIVCILFLLELGPAFAKDVTKYINIPKSLKTIISVNLKATPFEEALSVISGKGDFKLSHNRDRIPAEKKVSVKMENVPAINPLLKILKDTGTGLIITDTELFAVVPSSKSTAEINGVIVDVKSNKPLSGVNIVVLNSRLGTATDDDGWFQISKKNHFQKYPEVTVVGYSSQILKDIPITENSSVNLRFELEEVIHSIKEIIVTPGHFSLMGRKSVSRNTLSEEEIRQFPQLGDDICRVVKRLPGISGNDFSARFNVRGGEQDEVLILLDGMELFDPFHLKDFDGSLSIIDIEAIRNVEMMTGAFPAEYGNRLSGVFNMKTRIPDIEKRRTSLALSVTNARFLSEGSFTKGKGFWQIILRRGYIDYILDILGHGKNSKPVYHDVLGKAQYFINNNHQISAHLLASNDDFKWKDNEFEQLNAVYRNVYSWLNWEAQLHPRLLSQAVFSVGRIVHDRFSERILDNVLEWEASYIRNFNFYGFRQNWQYEFSPRYQLKLGIDSKNYSVDYDYEFISTNRDVHNTYNKKDVNLEKIGNELGLFLTNRFYLFTPLTAEIGIRYDYASWTKDKNISPRINLAYRFRKNTTIRAGWGKFYQTHSIQDLNIVDDDYTFYPAEFSEHVVFGLEHEFKNGINFRFEGYHKDHINIHPRYFNYRYIMDISVENSHDRVRQEPDWGVSKGFEIYLHKDNGYRHKWWLSYAYSILEDKIDGLIIPRKMDQLHTINADYSFQPSDKWALNLTWHYHSGWPYTEETIQVLGQYQNGSYYWQWAPGTIHGKRHLAYHRMDIRLSRYFKTQKGRISTYGEIRNLYNRKNIKDYDYINIRISSIDRYSYNKEARGWLPIMLSFGIIWDF